MRRTRSPSGPLATPAACRLATTHRAPSAGGRPPATSCASFRSTTRRRSRLRGRTATARRRRESTGRATARRAEPTTVRTRTPGPTHPPPGRAADRTGARPRRGRASASGTHPRPTENPSARPGLRHRQQHRAEARAAGRAPTGAPGTARSRTAERLPSGPTERGLRKRRPPAERQRGFERVPAPHRERRRKRVPAAHRWRELEWLSSSQQRRRQLHGLPPARRGQRVAALPERGRRWLASPHVGQRLGGSHAGGHAAARPRN